MVTMKTEELLSLREHFYAWEVVVVVGSSGALIKSADK